jgi:2-oxoisovalerate dehydrogenase E1 component
VEATREALAEEMAADPTIFVVGQGIGARGGNFKTTVGLFDLFGPDRLVDVPISERGFVGMCAGAAITGTRPVVDFMCVDFILDAIGELVNQAAKMQYMSNGRLRMPLVLRGCVGVGGSFATHHSGNYYPFFTHQPGFRVAYPSTPADAKGLFKSAIRSNDPVLFLEHRSLLNSTGPVPDDEFLVPFGKAEVVRAGTDVTAVAIAVMVGRTAAVAEQLESEGISVEVIDPRTVAPLDMETILKSVTKTGRLLIVDETYAPGSIGADIAAEVADAGFADLKAPIRRVNGLHTPIPYSPPLEAAAVPTEETIAESIRNLVAG